MKKQGSLWMLLAHSTLYKLLAVWAAVAAVQSFLFVRAVRAADILQNAGFQGAGLEMDILTQQSHLALLFGVGLVLTALVLSLMSWEQGAGLTLCRLNVSPRRVYLCRAAYGFLCFVLYWAMQAVLVLALAHWVSGVDGGDYGVQGFFLATWRSRFLHGLYPMMDWVVLLKNLALFALLAALVGRMPSPVAGKRRFPTSAVSQSILTAGMFHSTFGNGISLPVALLIIVAVVLGIILFSICQKEAKQDEVEE